MNILGIDPSLSSTGLVLLQKKGKKVSCIGTTIKTDPFEHSKRIHQVICGISQFLMEHKIFYRQLDWAFIESEAMAAKGQIVQLSELSGAIKYFFLSGDTRILTFTPSQSKKMVLGVGKCPNKKSTTDGYNEWIMNLYPKNGITMDTSSWKGTDVYDALVIATAGYQEVTTDSKSLDEKLILMRLHQFKELVKNNKGVYTLGTGKKATKFKSMKGLDKTVVEELHERYRGIFKWILL